MNKIENKSDFNFVLKLDKIKIPNVRRIRRIPDLEKVLIRGKKLYGVKYFITDAHNKIRVIRITSPDSNFKTIYTLDIYDEKVNPRIGLQIKENTPKEKFIEMISNIGIKKVKEDYSPTELFVNQKMLQESNWASKLIEKIETYFPSLMFILGLVSFFSFYIKDIINWMIETRAETIEERELNNELFTGQKGNEPEFIIYHKIQNYLNSVINKEMIGLLLYGPPGTSKTYIVRRTLHFSGKKPGKNYRIVKGSTLGLLSFYQLLYQNSNKLLILDDFDKPLRDENIVNLLKAATDSYGKRIVSLPLEKIMQSNAERRTKSSTPEKFNYRGQIIILTNLGRNKIDKSILSRIPSVEVYFSTEETIDAVKKMLKYINPSVDIKLKKETLAYILLLYKKNPKIKITFRSVKTSIDARIGNPKFWKEMVEVIVDYK